MDEWGGWEVFPTYRIVVLASTVHSKPLGVSSIAMATCILANQIKSIRLHVFKTALIPEPNKICTCSYGFNFPQFSLYICEYRLYTIVTLCESQFIQRHDDPPCEPLLWVILLFFCFVFFWLRGVKREIKPSVGWIIMGLRVEHMTHGRCRQKGGTSPDQQKKNQLPTGNQLPHCGLNMSGSSSRWRH